MLELAVRLVFSLAVVVGLLLLLAKLVRQAVRHPRRCARAGRCTARRSAAAPPSPSSPSAAGCWCSARTDHQVSLLTELDPDELDGPSSAWSRRLPEPADAPTLRHALESAGSPSLVLLETDVAPASRGRRAGGSHRATPAPSAGSSAYRPAGRLTGSVLSPQTWRQALAAATGRAS